MKSEQRIRNAVTSFRKIIEHPKTGVQDKVFCAMMMDTLNWVLSSPEMKAYPLDYNGNIKPECLKAITPIE